MKFLNEEEVTKIREGYYSAAYFNRTQKILLQERNLRSVTMQIFQKKDNVTVCGVQEVIELFKETAGYFENDNWINTFNELKIEALKDGDNADAWETVMHITGPYAYFAHLESVYLGILARQTKVATNAKRVVDAAAGKQVLFFADRFDYFVNQEIDGYAAIVGGVHGVATLAQAKLWNGQAAGTIPHALIAIHNGNTVAAAENFANQFPDLPLIVLVDFENDCVKTSLEVARRFGRKLFGVRLDTSEMLVDKSVTDQSQKGVSAELVKNVRTALNSEGFTNVKIVVSGGFNEEKIKKFEEEKIPVDVYGVGSSLLKGNIDFTADIVKVDGQHVAKEGRNFKESKRLQVIA